MYFSARILSKHVYLIPMRRTFCKQNIYFSEEKRREDADRKVDRNCKSFAIKRRFKDNYLFIWNVVANAFLIASK